VIDINYGMPAMGSMPAMFFNANAEFHEDSYHAMLSLSMAGTWNMNIEIQIPDKPRITLNFLVTTGVKGITLKSQSSKSMGTEEAFAMENVISISKEEENIIGTKTSAVEIRNLVKEIRTVGTIAYDPDLYVAQQEFLSALNLEDNDLIDASKRRLEILGMNELQIIKLEKSQKAESNLILPQNSAFVYATVYEHDLGLIKEGLMAEIKSLAYPGETFTGKVVSIPSILDPVTRSVSARIEIRNPNEKLKPGMFVDVLIKVKLGKKLVVPESAVINTGERSIVVVTDGLGNYSSLDVKVGQKSGNYYEVISGLKENDKVVTEGNFLIDSESRLRGSAQEEHRH